MLIMAISGTSSHFSIVGTRSRSVTVDYGGAFIIFSDCLVFFCLSFVTIRAVNLPGRTETDPELPNRTRLCRPYIAEIAS